MSDKDELRDHESLLTRWSRRKRRALAGCAAQQPKIDAHPDTNGAASPVEVSAEHPIVDSMSLPPIESIDAGTDIRVFLAKGVQPELASAALRRTWTSDPTICDFIGLSENSWDFNADGGIPGFGSIAASEVERLVAQLCGQPEPRYSAPSSAAQCSRSALAEQCPTEVRPAEHGDPDPVTSTQAGSAASETQTVQSGSSHQHAALIEAGDSERMPAPRHRAHGSALPR